MKFPPAAHRLYPPPESPWIMHQSWHDLLFAHWPVPIPVMHALIPDCMELDTFNGTAWVGVVPFHMSNVRPRFLPPVPYLSAFPELNVRTYVTKADKPGVYFFSLDASNRIAVKIARGIFHLPYFQAEMQVDLSPPESADSYELVHYQSRRLQPYSTPATLRCTYGPVRPVQLSSPGSLEHWLTERYCLYTTDPGGTLLRCDIHHAQWPLQQATANIEENTMAHAGGIPLPNADPLLHFAKQLDVLIWPLQRCDC